MSDTVSITQDYGHGITRVDASYIRPGLACFYLLQQGDQCAIIETGTSHSLVNLETALADRGIAPEQVRYVIPTHVHLDHAGGAGAMMSRFANARLVVHPRGAAHLIDPARLVASSIEVYGEDEFRRLYGEIVPIPEDRVLQVADQDVIELIGRPLVIRHTEGHARHHFCVWDAESQAWFSGDMFGVSYPWFRFSGGDYVLPSTTPTQFDPQAFHDSLDILHSYAPERIYLTHYGAIDYNVTLAELLRKQLDAYCQAAMKTDSKAELEKDLIALCAEFAGAIEGSPDDETLRRQLSFDADLNAQGLRVWRQRMARAAQGA